MKCEVFLVCISSSNRLWPASGKHSIWPEDDAVMLLACVGKNSMYSTVCCYSSSLVGPRLRRWNLFEYFFENKIPDFPPQTQPKAPQHHTLTFCGSGSFLWFRLILFTHRTQLIVSFSEGNQVYFFAFFCSWGPATPAYTSEQIKYTPACSFVPRT